MSRQPLTSLCTINPESLGPGTPLDFAFDYVDISAVTHGRINWADVRRVRYADAPSRARRRVHPGDVLLCTVRPGLKAHARIPDDRTGPTVASTGFAVLRPDRPTDTAYIFHQLLSDDISAQLRAMEVGSNYPAVNERDVARLSFHCPDEAMRASIALVLDAVDAAIAQTEAVIAKLKSVRAGLLHDLLTRGLDANGSLRPPPDQAPHLYKDSPLGKIPREWEVRGVLDMPPTGRQAILTGPFGAQLGQRDFRTHGVPVLRIGNVQSGYIDWADVQRVTYEKAMELSRFRVRTGDLLFARQGATTGRNALADDRAEGAVINYHIIRVAADHLQCLPVFLHAMFNCERTLRQVNRDKGRGTREGISSGQISSIRLALPRLEEQRRSVRCLSECDAWREQEKSTVSKLVALKSGLMSDLLTGRVRVGSADPKGQG